MPSGTDILRGARNKSWIVVTACLRSARRAIAALHPKQAHDATPVTNTTHLNLFGARMVPESVFFQPGVTSALLRRIMEKIAPCINKVRSMPRALVAMQQRGREVTTASRRY